MTGGEQDIIKELREIKILLSRLEEIVIKLALSVGIRLDKDGKPVP
jgi:hypothetical protein